MKQLITEPVGYNLLAPATVPVKKWRLYASALGALVIAIVCLGIMLSEYDDDAILLFSLLALVVYIIGYRLEKNTCALLPKQVLCLFPLRALPLPNMIKTLPLLQKTYNTCVFQKTGQRHQEYWHIAVG